MLDGIIEFFENLDFGVIKELLVGFWEWLIEELKGHGLAK